MSFAIGTPSVSGMRLRCVMSRENWASDKTTAAKAAKEKSERVRTLVAKLAQSKIAPAVVEVPRPPRNRESQAIIDSFFTTDLDFAVLTEKPNADLVGYVSLFDSIMSGSGCLHAALIWPHIPPRAILPWMVREVSRGRQSPPLRTLFINMNRSALQCLSGIEAKTAQLRARGVYRSGHDGNPAYKGEITPHAHFYMFLGDTKESGIQALPLISIVPHAVALNDGTYWRDFDEKTLRGLKRHFSQSRLQSIRKYLNVLASASKSPAFAFLLPSHFEASARRAALTQLPGTIDLVLIDMSTAAVSTKNISALLYEILEDLEQALNSTPKTVLIVTDCPLRFSFIRGSLRNRREPGALGNQPNSHRLVWASRGRGFDLPASPGESSPPIVETVASAECVVATRLWEQARKLKEDNPLSGVLLEGAVALKTMALTASGADAMLTPYQDAHDFYHQMKRERHSFEPHYAKAMALIGEGRGGPWRGQIEADLAQALSLARALRGETPLMRYLKRVLGSAPGNEDLMIVLRHPEDAQQSANLLEDFLTTPGSFSRGIPNLRVTTPSGYVAEVAAKQPTMVVWAGSADAGMRTYVGDSVAPRRFRLVVAGQDASILSRSLEVVADSPEYAPFKERICLLKNALPRVPEELGGVATALGLNPDRSYGALPFVGNGYLQLDGYGPVSASPGTQFYVLDPSTQQLHPREARSIEVGDSVFVMSAGISEEIEALLREKDELGRTFEQTLVEHYKEVVKSGIEKLSRNEGCQITAARVHELLFEKNPELPPITKHAIDYWLKAANHLDVETPYAAVNPAHFEAFLKLMGAGVIARQLADAVRVVRHSLRRDGHTNRGLFDRLLLDPDSLMSGRRQVTFDKLQRLRDEALQNVFPVLEIHFAEPALKESEKTLLCVAAT